MVFLFISFSSVLFCQNSRIDGYKGLWFSAGQIQEFGYKFSGGSATFGSQHRPVAIYSPESDKTFFVYGGTTSAKERHLLIMISYFDHSINVVPKPVVVYDKMGVREPFDNPSLAIDPLGFLWVFISGSERIRPGMIFKSTKPYSIDSFEKVAEKEMIAPQPWWIGNDGCIVIFIKKINEPEIFFSASTDGIRWTENNLLSSMGGHAQLSEIRGKKLTTVFNYFPGGDPDKQTNIYLLETEDMGKTWKTIDGKSINIPLVHPGNEALVKDFESEGKLVYISDINFDMDGNPVILAIISNMSDPGPDRERREWMILKWIDQKWDYKKVCESDHNFDAGALYITEKEWSVIGPSDPGPQNFRTGGEIVCWKSTDKGENWSESRKVTSGSQVNHSFVKRPVNANKEFYAFWTDGDADKLSPSNLYFTNQKCRKVWMLPYDMSSAFKKPRLSR
ncbi:MAG: BNR-4 repeat-containing protein [Bacteroidota bacterium]